MKDAPLGEVKPEKNNFVVTCMGSISNQFFPELLSQAGRH
jgi:hypothetical protein